MGFPQGLHEGQQSLVEDPRVVAEEGHLLPTMEFGLTLNRFSSFSAIDHDVSDDIVQSLNVFESEEADLRPVLDGHTIGVHIVTITLYQSYGSVPHWL